MSKIKISVSTQYRIYAFRAVAAIVLFIVTYLTMLFLVLAMTIITIYGGVKLILIKPMIGTILVGIGLSILGLLVLFFLLKFLIKSHKNDLSQLIEIRKVDEPKLFEFIEGIVSQVGTKFPKKIYLTGDVNASVFYDSSFWSMFLPIEKNLQIGLGMVNSVTKSEFAAILSHEFGHFSQKTMKIGSYVYHVNQVIFNLLYDNESYNNLAHNFGNSHGFLSYFVWVAIKITEGMQWILKHIYKILNKNYLSLSREMEFQADEIAAHLMGIEPAKSSLLRSSFSDQCLNYVFAFYGERENLKSSNLFKDHLFILNFLAKENNIPFENSLPQFSEIDALKQNTSKLVLKDQWASHPSITERIRRIEKTGSYAKNNDHEAANHLFHDIELLQKKITKIYFQDVELERDNETISSESFESQYKAQYFEKMHPEIFNGYYDNKNPIKFEINPTEALYPTLLLEDIFSDNQIVLIQTSVLLASDIETIKLISRREIDIKTFDYDGIKYTYKNTKILTQKLEQELLTLQAKIKMNDINIYYYFKNIEIQNKQNPKLDYLYQTFFEFDSEFDLLYALYIKSTEALNFIHLTTTFEQIRSNLRKFSPIEKEFKHHISLLMNDEKFKPFFRPAMIENFELYLSKDWHYFRENEYLRSSLEVLFAALNNFLNLISEVYQFKKKELLEYKVILYNSRILATTENK